MRGGEKGRQLPEADTNVRSWCNIPSFATCAPIKGVVVVDSKTKKGANLKRLPQRPPLHPLQSTESVFIISQC